MYLKESSVLNFNSIYVKLSFSGLNKWSTQFCDGQCLSVMHIYSSSYNLVLKLVLLMDSWFKVCGVL